MTKFTLPPPFLKTKYGNLQTFPNPTTYPKQDKTKSMRLLQFPRWLDSSSSSLSPLSTVIKSVRYPPLISGSSLGSTYMSISFLFYRKMHVQCYLLCKFKSCSVVMNRCLVATSPSNSKITIFFVIGNNREWKMKNKGESMFQVKLNDRDSYCRELNLIERNKYHQTKSLWKTNQTFPSFFYINNSHEKNSNNLLYNKADQVPLKPL